jgi:Fe-S oxidoreductase
MDSIANCRECGASLDSASVRTTSSYSGKGDPYYPERGRYELSWTDDEGIETETETLQCSQCAAACYTRTRTRFVSHYYTSYPSDDKPDRVTSNYGEWSEWTGWIRVP